MSREVVDAVLADYRTAPIEEKLRATLAYLEKLTLKPNEMTKADAEAVLATGVTKEMLTIAIHVCAGFSMIVRIADATNFEVPDAKAFEQSATMLLKLGYKL